jgi:hypothetical protein
MKLSGLAYRAAPHRVSNLSMRLGPILLFPIPLLFLLPLLVLDFLGWSRRSVDAGLVEEMADDSQCRWRHLTTKPPKWRCMVNKPL